MDDQKNVEAKIDLALKQVVARSEGSIQSTPEDETKFHQGYSLAALVFGPFYFAAMNDWLFVFLSIVFGLIFFPLLFVLPISARSRAWKMHYWADAGLFIKVQRLWDKSAIYFSILSVVIVVMAFQFIALPLIRSVSASLNGADLNDLIKNFQ